MRDRTRREALAAVAGLAGLAGCIGDPPGGPGGTVSPTDDGPERTDTGEDAVRWAVQFDGPVTETPALADGAVVAGTGLPGIGTPDGQADGDWTLAAMDAGDGGTRWSLDLSAPTFRSPVVAAGATYVPAGFSSGMVGTDQRVVKVVDGEQTWASEPGTGFYELLGVDADGRAFVGTSDDAIGPDGQRMFALDGDDGSDAWAVESGDAFGGRLVDGDLLADLGGVALERRATDDGSRRWRTETEVLREPDGTIPTVDGVVPVAPPVDDTESIGALDVADGSVRWTFDEDLGGPFVPTGATTVPGVGDGLVVASEYDGYVYGLSTVGDEVWRFEADGDTRDGAVADGDRVFVGDLDGTMYALDAASGEEQWRADTGGPVGWFGVGGDTVVAEAGKGSERLVGLAAADGATRWTFTGGGSLTRPRVGDGGVVVGSESGVVRMLGD
jgi:outer membrane protein assembly factor BamB